MATLEIELAPGASAPARALPAACGHSPPTAITN